MSKNIHPLKCTVCEKDFLGYRSSDKFCSSYCRWRNSFLRRTEAQTIKRKEAFKRWGQENWLKRRNYMLRYTYGITSEQYDDLLRKQSGNCAICGKHNLEFARKLAIDHDHKTSEIRGLLCEVCNRKIVGKHRGVEGAEIFRKAAAYLDQEYTGILIPPKPKRKKRKRHANRIKKTTASTRL